VNNDISDSRSAKKALIISIRESKINIEPALHKTIGLIVLDI